MSDSSNDEILQSPTNNLFKIKFSEDDMAILRQCSRESFYQRCLPLSAIFGLLTYYAVKIGYWQPNKRFGAIPKIVLAVGLAFYAGKLSYRDECMEKFMQSPNSKVGEFLRDKFGRQQPKPAKSEEVEKSEETTQNDVNDSKFDNFRNFTEDSNFQMFLQPSTSQMRVESFTQNNEEPKNDYEDRRKRNREEYAKRLEHLKKKELNNPKNKRNNTNQYGDKID